MKLTKRDYRKWAQYDSWTTVNFACLLAGLDPDLVKSRPRGIQYEISDVAENDDKVKELFRMVSSWSMGTNHHPFWFLNKAILENFKIPQHLLKVVIEKFERLSQRDETLSGIYPDLAKKTSPKIQTLIDKTECHFCGHNYSTSHLKIMGKAIKNFWVDPSNSPPTKDTVVAWLIDEWKKGEYKGELSKHMAKAIDSIIRRDDRKKGGNISSQ